MKKVIIFTSGAAGGQASVTEALTHTLSQDYTVTSISFFYELLAPLDIAHRNNAESMYNWIALRKWNKFINHVFYTAAIYYYRLRRKKILSIIRAYLLEQQPNLVISIIPFVNGEIFRVTQELNIPFFLFSADLDPAMYLLNIQNTHHANFYMGLPFKDEFHTSLLEKHQIDPKQVIVTGYPVRPSFLTEKNRQQLRRHFAIPDHKPVILMLLGSQGTQTLPEMVRALYRIQNPAHIFICTGKAEHLAKKIDEIPIPKHLTKQIIGYTNHIADLMAVADIFVTKSGSVSVAEALYMHTPMLLDATSEVLLWEQFNHEFISKNLLGSSITRIGDLPIEVDSLLLNPENLTFIRHNFELLEKKNGCLMIKQLADQITANHPKNIPMVVYA